MSKVDLDKEEKAFVVEQFVTKFDDVLGRVYLLTRFINKTENDNKRVEESLAYLQKLNNKIKNLEKLSEINNYLYLKRLYKRFDDNGKENLFNR